MATKEQLKQAVISDKSDLRTAMLSIKSTGLNMAVIINDYSHVVGIITDGDIRKQLLEDEDLNASVKTCMSKDFAYVKQGFKREELLKLLDRRIFRIPVLDSKGVLIDIVGSDYHFPDVNSIVRSRAPARVSLSGGGTDFTEYFTDYGGAGLSCTIAKYSHAVLRKRTDQKIKIYSHDYKEYLKLESIDDIHYDGKLDLIKAGIKLMNPRYGFEMELGCDYPPASGLGGSASLLASVIGCMNELRENRLDKYAIAEYAFEAERIELEIAGGWQDQYSTVFGGFNYLEFDRQHNVVMPLKLENKNIRELEESLILCHTKKKHLGELIQKDNRQTRPSIKNPKKNSERLKEITAEMKRSLLRTRFDDFALLIEETWEIKKETDPRVTNPELDKIHSTAINAGAIGGRLLGTGGGGYFLFYTPPFCKYQVIESLENIGLNPESIIVDQKGLTSWRA